MCTEKHLYDERALIYDFYLKYEHFLYTVLVNSSGDGKV